MPDLAQIGTLMVLLFFAYLGAVLVGGHVLRGFGLPSGTEFVALGFILGPTVAGTLDARAVAVFDPLALVALGWLSMLIGLEYRLVGTGRVALRTMLLGLMLALLGVVTVAAATFFVADQLQLASLSDRVVLALGAGAACAETTRHALRWVAERYGVNDRGLALLGELSIADDLIPLLVTAIVFGLDSTGSLGSPTAWASTAVTLLIGLLAGLAVAGLLGRRAEVDRSWSILLGAAFLIIGLTHQIGLSPLAAMVTLGIALALASPIRDNLRDLLFPTEQAVLVPLLLLAGVRVELHGGWLMVVIVSAAVGTRVLVKLLSGLLIRRFVHELRARPATLGLALLPSGGTAIIVGFVFALKFPGPIGSTVLLIAITATVFGEFVGMAALRILFAPRTGSPDEPTLTPASSAGPS